MQYVKGNHIITVLAYAKSAPTSSVVFLPSAAPGCAKDGMRRMAITALSHECAVVDQDATGPSAVANMHVAYDADLLALPPATKAVVRNAVSSGATGLTIVATSAASTADLRGLLSELCGISVEVGITKINLPGPTDSQVLSTAPAWAAPVATALIKSFRAAPVAFR